ncbi:MAG: sugar transferase [Gemmatimonadetes bacterium]|nr:sugar transferase [Gemmatimonadota bacterium]
MTITAASHSRPSQQTVAPRRSDSARVSLHRRAPEVARRHPLFSTARVVALLACDLGLFFLFRAVVDFALNRAVQDSFITRLTGTLFPAQYHAGWQFPIAMVLGLAFAGTYGRAGARRDVGALLAGVAFGTALCVWQNAWVIGGSRVALQFVATVGFLWVPIVAGRLTVEFLVSRAWPVPQRVERVLFVGNPDDPAAQFVSSKLMGSGGVVSLGWVNGSHAGNGNSGNGSSYEMEYWATLHRLAADTVVVSGHLPDEVFHSVVEASTAAGCRILIVPRYDGMAKMRPGVVWHRGLPFIELAVPSLQDQQLFVKQVIDVLGAAIGLILLAPFFGLIALAIRLDSPGPAFFSQERVGLGGRVFRFYKFRTMRDGADEEKASMAHLNHTGDPRLFKIPNDPRVTRVGAFLRPFSLDELPQLWNVLIGDMSIVGPRPFFESDLDAYRDHHFSRLGAKPGITGLWQVSGRSDVVDFEEVVRLDREYIEQWSLWLDLKIMARTIPAVFGRAGAF